MAKRFLVISAKSGWDLLLHLGIIISLGLILILFVFSVYLPGITNHGETVTVPDLQGMSVDEIDKFLSAQNRNLRYEIRDSNYSAKHKPYIVLTQSPEPGAKVKENRTLFLTINPKTPPKVKVPKLKDMPFKAAERTLRHLGLDVGRLKYKPFIGENVVLEQRYRGKEITPGTFVKKGTRIDLVVGDGIGEKEFDVPDLVGLPLDEAEFVLTGSQLHLGEINYVYNSSQEIGTVIRQTPKPYFGTLEKGVKKGSQFDKRQRSQIHAGEIIDLWVVGNPAAKPQEEIDESNLSEEEQRELDSLRRNINQRSPEEIEEILKKRKGISDKDKKKKPKPKPEED